MRRAHFLPLVLVALTPVACSLTPEDSGPMDARLARSLAAVRLDPAEAGAAINAYRAERGLRPLRLDPALTAMAQTQADAMAANSALSHTLAGAFVARLAAAKVDASEAGENLGGGYFSVQEAVSGWRHSAEHDANMRIAGATRFGVAIAKNPQSHYGVYWALEIAAEPRASTGSAGLLTSTSGAPVAAQ